MEFSKLIEHARDVRKKYEALEKHYSGRVGTGEELMLGFVKDIGDLAKLVQAKEGIRSIDDIDQKLAHELSDCLWSVIVLADYYDIDLEKSFLKTMDHIRTKIKDIRKEPRATSNRI